MTKRMDVEKTSRLRASRSFERVIHTVFSHLSCYFEDSATNGDFKTHLDDRFDAMERDRSITERSIIANFLQQADTMMDEVEIARQRIVVAINISLYFCFQANKAYLAGKDEKAWILATNATKWQGVAGGSEYAFVVRRDTARDFAAAGGRGRSDIYEPLRQFSVKAAKEKTYRSKRNAALSIKPAVLELARKLGIPLSEQQAEKTITGWLKDIPFARTGGPQQANMLP